jgi:hypothetical protein
MNKVNRSDIKKEIKDQQMMKKMKKMEKARKRKVSLRKIKMNSVSNKEGD